MEIEKVLEDVTNWVAEIISTGAVKETTAVMRGFDCYTACVDRVAVPPIPGCITIKVVGNDADTEDTKLYFMPNGFYMGSSLDKFVFMDSYTDETLVANMRKHYRYYECNHFRDGSIDVTFSEGAGIFEGCWLPDITVSHRGGKVTKLT